MTSATGGLVGVAILAVLAGCGSASSTTTGVDEVSAAYADVDDTYRQIWGTGYERDAARYVSFVESNRDFAQCMLDEGQSVRLEFEPIFQGMNLGASTQVWIGPLERRPSERWAANREARQVVPGFAAQSDPESKGYRDAAAVCLPLTREVDEQEISQPSVALELGSQLQAILDAVDKTLPSPDEYRRCMQNGGFSWPEGGYEGTSGAEQALTEQLARVAPGVDSAGNARTGALPDDFLAEEERFVAADRDCRATVLADAAAALTEPMEEFRRTHQADLAEVRQEWVSRVKTAQELGFPSPKEL